jgi:hypothetical protein
MEFASGESATRGKTGPASRGVPPPPRARGDLLRDRLGWGAPRLGAIAMPEPREVWHFNGGVGVCSPRLRPKSYLSQEATMKVNVGKARAGRPDRRRPRAIGPHGRWPPDLVGAHRNRPTPDGRLGLLTPLACVGVLNAQGTTDHGARAPGPISASRPRVAWSGRLARDRRGRIDSPARPRGHREAAGSGQDGFTDTVVDDVAARLAGMAIRRSRPG